jgi:hypothetical protein
LKIQELIRESKTWVLSSFKYCRLLSLMQFRFIALVLVGVTVIAEARLSITENLISVLWLALLMVWPMLIPVVVFLVLGERRQAAVKSMRTWLTRNKRMINVVVLGAFGILLLAIGLIGILSMRLSLTI